MFRSLISDPSSLQAHWWRRRSTLVRFRSHWYTTWTWCCQLHTTRIINTSQVNSDTRARSWSPYKRNNNPSKHSWTPTWAGPTRVRRSYTTHCWPLEGRMLHRWFPTTCDAWLECLDLWNLRCVDILKWLNWCGLGLDGGPKWVLGRKCQGIALKLL